MADTTAVLVADHLDDCRRCGLDADTYRALIASLARLSPPHDAARLQRLRSFAETLTAA